jgi:hypothetical protein
VTTLLQRLVGILARRQRLPSFALFNFIAVQSMRWVYSVFPEFSGSRIWNVASYDGLQILTNHLQIKGISDEEITDRLCPEPYLQHRLRPVAPQSDNIDKPGMNNTDKAGIKNGSMGKETTGTNNGTSKKGLSKDGMKKDDMKK